MANMDLFSLIIHTNWLKVSEVGLYISVNMELLYLLFRDIDG